METRSRKRIFSLVDSDIPKNVNLKIQKKNIQETNVPIKPIMNEEKEKEKKDDYLTQYESNKITFEEFFEFTKLQKGFLQTQLDSKLNNNMYFDIPISIRSYYYSIMNIITNQKNYVKTFDNIESCNDFLKSSVKKYFILCKNNKNEHIHKLYNLDENIAKCMYYSNNKNVSSLITLNGFDRAFISNATYNLNKNINIKDIYLFSYSAFNQNSNYINEKVKLINDFYVSFDIDKEKVFTRMEIYDIFIDYVKTHNLISKYHNEYIVMDAKLGNLLNINRPIHASNFRKLIRQLIIPFNSCKIENYLIDSQNFSDFILNETICKNNNIKNGLYRKYNKDGKIILETYYVNNIEDGIRKKYDNNGKLRSMIEYHNNKKDGSLIIFDENENVVCEFMYTQNIIVNCNISPIYE